MADEKEVKAEPLKVVKQPSAVELLIAAAEALEKQQGPRANKYYRNLAVTVRQLAAKAAQ